MFYLNQPEVIGYVSEFELIFAKILLRDGVSREAYEISEFFRINEEFLMNDNDN